MEITYLYIRKYRNLENIELNFSSEISVKYAPTSNQLYFDCKPNPLPKNFWGENICNLTMIVGNNAAGKTSIMHYLISICQNLFSSEQPLADGFIVLRQKKKLYYYEISLNIKTQKPLECVIAKNLIAENFSLDDMDYETLQNIFKSVKMIYFTNTLSFTDYERTQRTDGRRLKPFYDCSVGGLMYSDSISDVNQALRASYNYTSEFQTYYTYEKYKQVKFVFDKRQHKILEALKKDGYPVPVPDCLYIDLFVDNQLRFLIDRKHSNLYTQVDWDKKFFPTESEAYYNNINNINTNRLLRYQFCRCCIWSMTRSISRIFRESGFTQFFMELENWKINFDKNKNEFKQTITQIWNFSEEFAKKKAPYCTSKLLKFRTHCEQYYQAFIDYIEQNANDIGKHFTIEPTKYYGFINQENKKIIRLSVSTSDADWFMEFLEKYRYTSEPDYYLDFDWGLSSGETNLLSTFALLYCVFPMDYSKSKSNNYKIVNEWKPGESQICDTLIILGDEVDLTLHPDWQTKYIDLLTAFLSKIFPTECCPNIQLILSTHSPILLSDVPEQNAIFLKAADNKKTKIDSDSSHATFGQNIHLLYEDGFFLKKGVMGQFAYKKIQQCFNDLKTLETDIINLRDSEKSENLEYIMELEQQKSIVNAIAEPIIQKHLLHKIEKIEALLTPKESTSHIINIPICKLTEEQLDHQLLLLTEEKERRKYDKNSNT